MSTQLARGGPYRLWRPNVYTLYRHNGSPVHDDCLDRFMAMHDDNSATTILVQANHALEWTTSLLELTGVARENAKIVASSLVLADLRGVDTHGLSRLEVYVTRVQAGSLQPNPPLDIVQKTPVMASIDAQDTFGFVAAHVATDRCIRVARIYGVGITAVRNSGHLGMAATYVLQAMEQGYAALVFSNSSPAMPPWGSREPLWGTNPLAVGFPGGERGDFLLDMSPAVVARGKVIRAAKRGDSIPEGWMLDAQGRPTTDAAAALAGAGTVLPIGGPKGSGLAAMVDLFAGVVTGASFAGAVLNQREETSKPSGQGHWIMVFQPDAFLESKEEYLKRMDAFLDRVRSCQLAAGSTHIFTPGEKSAQTQKKRTADGIPYSEKDVVALNELGARLGHSVRFA